jgi:hypothetical protein
MDINVGDTTSVEEILPGVRVTATGNGTGVDVKDYVGKAKVVLISSAGGGSTPTLDVKLQDSPDNSAWTDISGAAFTQVTDAADSTEAISLDLNNANRYIRAVKTVAGSSPTFDCGLVMVGVKQVSA